MATYTQNYTLHQWEDSDDFLRTDFNSDFLKLDTALGAIASSATTAQAASVSNAYNIYNLMLQNYYEGKYTGYKTALLFDGFMDSEGISSLTTGFVRTQDSLNLYSTAQSSITRTLGSSNLILSSLRTSPTVTMTGSGLITSFVLNFYGGTQSGVTVTYKLYLNDELSRSGTYSVGSLVASTPYQKTVTPSSSIAVAAGDTVYVTVIIASGSNVYCTYDASSTSNIWTQYNITGTAASSGTMVAVGSDIDWTQAYGWVRYTGGTVGLSLVNAGTTHSLTCTETASAVNLQGVGCTEATFYLQNSADIQGTVAPQIVASRSSTVMKIYDYGIVFL